MGHGDNAVTEQNMTNPARDRAKYGDESETMKALAWMGKNDCQIGIDSTISICLTAPLTNTVCSRNPQAQSHRRPRRDPKSDRLHHLRL